MPHLLSFWGSFSQDSRAIAGALSTETRPEKFRGVLHAVVRVQQACRVKECFFVVVFVD